MKVKICGITTVKDALLATGGGADYIGVIIEIKHSPRRLTIEQALPIFQQSPRPVVALFFNWDAGQIREAVSVLHPGVIQLQGQETPSLVKELKGTINCEIWKAIHVPSKNEGKTDFRESLEKANTFINAGVDAIILDTVVGFPGAEKRYGGTGEVSDWDVARELVKAIPGKTFLAGGINPDNVRQAIEQVKPYGIDLCSGVEASFGVKDPQKLKRLMEYVHETEGN